MSGYVLLGHAFGNRAQTMIDLLSDLIWVVVGAIFVLGRRLLRYRRGSPAPEQHALQE